MEPQVIFEDKDILIIQKPAGLTVNSSDTTKGERTVQDWAEAQLKIQPFGSSSTSLTAGSQDKSEKFRVDETSDFYKRGGIVHRLDKETSGVLIIAKNEGAFTKLQAQFKERTVKKIYTALAHGKVIPETGEIRVPVGRLPWNRKRFGVIAGGREAVTKYRVLGIRYLVLSNEKIPLSLIELYPETGRTHQIRVHLKYIGYPIFSDFLYAGRKTMRKDRKFLGRVFLHASKITFTHPQTGKQVTFESPLPKDLDDFFRSLTELN